MIPTPTQPPQSLAQQAVPQADYERRRHMQEAWKAYRGKLPPPLKVRANQPNDNVLSNRCAPIVDKGVSFLFGHALKIEATEEAAAVATATANTPGAASDTPPTPVQDFLNGLWGDSDDCMTTLAKHATNGGVCGHGFLKLIPAQGQMKYPRIVVLDPGLVRIVTAPDDCELVLAYVIEYPGNNGWLKRQIIARIDPDGLAETAGEYDLDDSWTITNYQRKEQGAGMWQQVGKQDVWPYPFAPIFSNQNLPNPNEAWGTPDLTPDIIEMNNVLNFVQSNTSRIIKFHAHPKTYATGTSATQINIAIDDLICLPSPDSKLNNLEMKSDLASSLNFAATLRADMDEQSRVPAVALGRTAELPKGNISGVALQLLFQPLIEKTIMKQRLYGRCIRELSRAALVIAGHITLDQYESYPIGLFWQDLLPVDDLAAAQTGAILVSSLGVSKATVQQQLGYSPGEEAEKTQVEAQATLTNYARGQGMPPAAQLPQQDTAQQNAAGMGQS